MGPCFADGLPRQGHPGLGSPAPPRGRLSPARCLACAVSRTELRMPAPLCLRVRPGCSGCPGQAAPTWAAQGPLPPHAITATVPRAPGAIASAVAPLSLGHEARRFSLGRFCSLRRRGLRAVPPGPRGLPQGMRWPRVEGEPLASRAPWPWQAGPPPRALRGLAAGAAARPCPPDVSGARGARGVPHVPQAVRRRQDGQWLIALRPEPDPCLSLAGVSRPCRRRCGPRAPPAWHAGGGGGGGAWVLRPSSPDGGGAATAKPQGGRPAGAAADSSPGGSGLSTSPPKPETPQEGCTSPAPHRQVAPPDSLENPVPAQNRTLRISFGRK